VRREHELLDETVRRIARLPAEVDHLAALIEPEPELRDIEHQRAALSADRLEPRAQPVHREEDLAVAFVVGRRRLARLRAAGMIEDRLDLPVGESTVASDDAPKDLGALAMSGAIEGDHHRHREAILSGPEA